MASGEIISSTGTNLNLVFTWSTARVGSTRTAEVTVRAYIQFTSLECVARSGQSMVIGGESHTFGTSSITDYTGSIHRVEATAYSDGSGSNRKTFTYDDNGNLSSQSISGSWLFNGTFSGTYIGTITVSGSASFDSIEPANTAPTWGASTITYPSTNVYIPENQTSITVTWGAASDVDGDTLYYDVTRMSTIGSGLIADNTTSLSVVDTIGAGNEGSTYQYDVYCHDGTVGTSDVVERTSAVITKNTLTAATLNATSTIIFTETIGYNTLTWSAGTNTNGSGISSYKIDCSTAGVTMQNKTVAISSGYQLPIYVTGTLPTGPYINFSDLKTKFPLASSFQGTITIVLTTTNTYGTVKTSNRTVSVDLRTSPRKASDNSVWTAVVPTIDSTDTYSYLIDGTRYYIPNRRSTYVTWPAAEDPLGEAVRYDLRISLDGGSNYSTIVSDTTNLYGSYSTPVTARKPTKFQVVAKTAYNYTQTSAASAQISLDYYNTPSFNNFIYTRTTTAVTVTGTIVLNTSITPQGTGTGATMPTNAAVSYIGQQAATEKPTTESFSSPTFTFNITETDEDNGGLVQIDASTTYTFTVKYTDVFIVGVIGNGVAGTTVSTPVSILAYNPMLSVRSLGVGINALATADYILNVGGKVNSTEGFFKNGVEVGTANPLTAYPVGAVYISVVSTSPATLFGGTWSAFATGRVLVGINAGDTAFDTVEETGGEKTHAISTGELPQHTHTSAAHDHGMNSHTHTSAAHQHNIGHTHTAGSLVALIVLKGTGPVHTQETSNVAAWTSNYAHPGTVAGYSTSTAEGWGAVVTGTTDNAGMTGTVWSDSTTPGATGAATGNTASTTPGATGGGPGSGTAHNNLQPYVVVYMWKRTA